MSKTVFKYDKTALDNIKKFVEANHYVKIGVLSISPKRPPDKKTGKSVDAVALAMVHEFGSPAQDRKGMRRTIPERSFLRKTYANYQDKFKSDMANAEDRNHNMIASGKGNVFLFEVGVKWVKYVVETFTAQGPGWAPLSKRRIAERSVTGRAKGNKAEEFHSILWDTGEMLRSIHHQEF
jgi:hypothetical protein